jgi:hypothetical protein
MNVKILKNLLIYTGSPRPPAGGLGMTGIWGNLKKNFRWKLKKYDKTLSKMATMCILGDDWNPEGISVAHFSAAGCVLSLYAHVFSLCH